MAHWLTTRQLERSDRHVQRCNVRSGGQISPTLLSFYVEEALRLIILPGENEGRVYYFRHVLIANLSTQSHRDQWISAFEHTLTELATHAIHGSDNCAPGADSIFFHNRQEALETLLARTLLGERPDEWFWPQVIGSAMERSRAERVLTIVQKLCELEGSWVTVADSVLRVIGSRDPLNLLAMLPPPAVNCWLQELTPSRGELAHPRPVRVQKSMQEMLERSVKALGSTDPRVIWLASLVVLRTVPSALSLGEVAKRAQATLFALSADPAELQIESATRMLSPTLPRRDDSSDIVIVGRPPQKNPGFLIEPLLDGDLQLRLTSPGGASDLSGVPSDLCTSSKDFIRAIDDETLPGYLQFAQTPERVADASHELKPFEFVNKILLSEVTQAAGLFFLLNVLRGLGIAEALAVYPAAEEQGLVPQIMKRLATLAKVDAQDPVWHWINSSLSQGAPADNFHLVDTKLFPTNLRPSRREAFLIEYFSRVWCVAIRRWCWHTGRITLQEVVNRAGWLSLNRTDLDVTLPLSSAEIRIRRVALDVDPGWLPWFGRVIRFHYVSDEAPHVN